MRVLQAVGSWVLVASIGCGGASPTAASPRPTALIRFAIVAPSWATEPAVADVDARALLESSQEGGGVRSELVADDSGCASEPACLQSLSGRRFDKLITVRLAALGETVLVRGVLVDVASGTQDETRQVVVSEASSARLEAALGELGHAFAKPYLPPPPSPARQVPAYETWWFWTAIAASVAVSGAVVTGAVVATQPQPDVVITPP